MVSRTSFGSVVSLGVMALACCALGLKADIVQAQGPKIRPPLPAKGVVSAELLRLLQVGPQAPGTVSGVSAEMMQLRGGRVGVTVTARAPEALVPALQQLGMTKITVAQEHHRLEGMIPLRSLTELEALRQDGLLGVIPLVRPWIQVGAVTSQADFTLEAERARVLPTGLTGAGVKIGVLSDSYDFLGGAAAGQASGDLPNVQVIEDDGDTDEGRGMIELVHDLAPGSPIAFATAFTGEAGFANNIRKLANNAIGNCDVIVDDVIYFAEPMFQDGIIAQAVNDVVTQNNVAYFSSAGNQANRAWEIVNPTTANDPNVAGTFIDFNPAAGVDVRQRVTIPAQRRITFTGQWDDPYYTQNGVDTDLGVVVLTANTNNVLGTIDENNITSQVPNEIYQLTNFGSQPLEVDVMLRVTSGPAPKRIKFIPFGSTPTFEFASNSGTTFGHSAAKNAMSVAASPYFDQQNLEDFSSGGPVTIFFQANGTRLGAPETRQKPNITATDGCDTTFFGQDAEGNGFPNFFGTSAAAPHAAAVAALIRQKNPGFSPQDIYDRLIDTATDMGAPGVDNQSGAGMINAFDALHSPVQGGALPFTDGFETKGLSRNWSTRSTVAGRVFGTSANGPAVGTSHIGMDSLLNGTASLNEMVLNLAPAPGAAITLAFRQKEFNDADQPMPATFNGSSNTDGVAISVNGNNWFRVVSLTGGDSTNAYRDVSFNLTQIAQAAGLNIGNSLLIKFQQFGDKPLGTGGMVFDDIRVTSAAPADGPDLIFSKFAPKPKEARGKASIVGSVTVKNAGNKKAGKSKVKFFLSADNVLNTNTDLAIKEVSVPKINPNRTAKIKLKLKLPAGTDPSTQFFFGVLDSQLQVTETIENNNIGQLGPLP